jgi:hypothetical protein
MAMQQPTLHVARWAVNTTQQAFFRQASAGQGLRFAWVHMAL